ncbi:unnamed protein product [Sphagnum troendelagicum]|uniref:Beta-carotene isomerase D27-like C-terminal domain-containing protein n=1 Tax=Sphagnum troendelagicum TaxID=128251 RepID=A0ABP0V083_9BRYO
MKVRKMQLVQQLGVVQTVGAASLHQRAGRDVVLDHDNYVGSSTNNRTCVVAAAAGRSNHRLQRKLSRLNQLQPLVQQQQQFLIKPPGPRCKLAEPSGKVAAMGHKSQYKDSWLDNLLIALFVGRMQQFTGMSTEMKGYEGFVDVARKVMQSRSPLLQRATTTQVLHSAVPSYLLKAARKFIPKTKRSAEIFAAASVFSCQWLVGPCEVKEVEVNGSLQKSGVLIKKCRFLESSSCVGMCVNLCKLPTQDFITNEFGMPITMTPNFEDMSCEMVYGQLPPSLEDDPSLKQPCYASLCSTAQEKASHCPKTSV